MSIAVGIPRALLYYRYAPLWETFFSELGAEVLISPSSNRTILKKGLMLAESEICLPVKTFFGHVAEISRNTEILFIPRMVGVENKEYTCPKFLGLPDMVKACGHPVPDILSPVIDMRHGYLKYYRTIFEVGRLFTGNKEKITRAYLKGMSRLKNEAKAFKRGEIPYLQDANSLEGETELKKANIKIAVLGHPYNIFDPFTSLNLIRRLQKMGIDVVTAEMLPPRSIAREASKLPKKLFWTYEKDIVGAALFWLHKKSVDGVIYVLSFACGPDSLIELMLNNKYKENKELPLMALVLDEHASETGVMTRLEAFVDMIYRQKQRKLQDVI